MLTRKNKDLRTIKEGVVGKYVKKDTPPEMPSKLLWGKKLNVRDLTSHFKQLSMCGVLNQREGSRTKIGPHYPLHSTGV